MREREREGGGRQRQRDREREHNNFVLQFAGETGIYTELPSYESTSTVIFGVSFKHSFRSPPCVSLTLVTLEVNSLGHVTVQTRAQRVDGRGFHAAVTLGSRARVYTVTVAYIACLV